jgi:hypothetical protein
MSRTALQSIAAMSAGLSKASGPVHARVAAATLP